MARKKRDITTLNDNEQTTLVKGLAQKGLDEGFSSGEVVDKLKPLVSSFGKSSEPSTSPFRSYTNPNRRRTNLSTGNAQSQAANNEMGGTKIMQSPQVPSTQGGQQIPTMEQLDTTYMRGSQQSVSFPTVTDQQPPVPQQGGTLPQPPQQQGQQPSGQSIVDAATSNQIEQDQQSFLQDIKYAGKVHDMNIDKMNSDYDNYIRDVDRRLEETKTGINNQIDDIIKQTERTTESLDKAGALKGFNRSSGFIDGLNNIRSDSETAINRLRTSFENYEAATADQKEDAYKSLQRGLEQAKINLEYSMRELMDLERIEVNTLVDKYGLSDEKLSSKLDSITLDVLNKRENLISSYIQNTRNTIQAANDQIGVIQNYENYLGMQRDRFTNILNMDNGASLASLTADDIQAYVDQGFLSPEQGAGYYQLMVGKSTNTLFEYGQPTEQDVQEVQSLIRGGMSAQEAVTKIMNDNPDRYSAVVMEQYEPVPGMSGTFYRTDENGQIEYYTIPGSSSTNQTNNQSTTVSIVNELGGRISSYGGEHDNYTGLDIAAPEGSEIPSQIAGEVVKVVTGQGKSDTPSYGNYIDIKASDGTIHRLSHLQNSFVQEGDQVNKGQVVATVGDTGYSTGPHLDYTIRDANGNFMSSKEVEKALSGQDQGPVGALGIPVSYERSVKNLVPATLMNSEVELNQLNNTITSMYEAGISQQDAALYFMGFDIQDESQKPLAQSLVAVGRMLPQDVSPGYIKTISDFVNNGQLTQAVRKAENTAMSYAEDIEGGDFVSESTAKTAAERVNQITDFIDNLENEGKRSPIGVFNGSFEKWLGSKFRRKDAQKVMTEVEQLVSKMRNDLLGSDASNKERRMIEPLIPSINDSAQNFMVKLNNLKNAPMQEHNNIRDTYGLPKLGEQELLDASLRVGIYGGDGSTMPDALPQPTTQEQPVGNSVDSILNNYFQ